ncbi:hypothetical protein [Nannocystis pusilla]|uniref:hypothetical protein n=1 Tax=Nannocystis pusilla TaxID=889268 RepID=UPI003B76B346
MRTSTNTISLLLASTFILDVACDDATGPGFAADDDVALRCTTPDCTPPPINNTSKIGDHYLSNIAMAFNTPVENETAEVFIEGATAIFGGTLETVAEIAVGDNGELRLRSMVTNTIIGGEAVEGARFYVYLDSYEDGSRKLAQLRIADAECDPGLYDPTITICRYTFVTDAVPADTELYPEHETLDGWFHTCPNETEGGQLGSAYKFSSVLSPNVALSIGKGTPRIHVAPGTFINGCLNGAVSKGQYRLNAFYDLERDPRPRPEPAHADAAHVDGVARRRLAHGPGPADLAARPDRRPLHLDLPEQLGHRGRLRRDRRDLPRRFARDRYAPPVDRSGADADRLGRAAALRRHRSRRLRGARRQGPGRSLVIARGARAALVTLARRLDAWCRA